MNGESGGQGPGGMDLPSGIRRVLEPGEWVTASARLHGSIYVPAIAISWLWGALYIWAAARGLTLVALLALAVLAIAVPALFLWAIWRRRSSFALLTNRRVIAVTGPVPVTAAACDLARIDRVRVRRSLIGGLMGAGAVDVLPLDTDGTPVSIADVADADAFAAAVREAAGAGTG